MCLQNVPPGSLPLGFQNTKKYRETTKNNDELTLVIAKREM